jgi:hypothetical protein
MPVVTNPSISVPAAVVGTMGRITSTFGGPRTVQLGARVKF